MSFQFPSSPFMDKLDILHSFIMGFLVAIVTFVLVWLYFLLLRFTYKIRNLNVLPRIVQIQHNSLLEFVWTVVPFIILLIIFSSSAALIYDGANKTHIYETIKIIGNQWYWRYSSTVPIMVEEMVLSPETTYVNLDYDSYLDASAKDYCFYSTDPTYFFSETMHGDIFYLLLADYQLFITSNEWLRFLISSSDVIHSWALPAVGIKCDAVPGRINEVISLVSFSGEYFGQCSELCGINHGFMPIQVWAFGRPDSY